MKSVNIIVSLILSLGILNASPDTNAKLESPTVRIPIPKLPIEIKTIFSTENQNNTVGVEIKNNAKSQLILARPGIHDVKWDVWEWQDEDGGFVVSPIISSSRSLPASHHDLTAIRNEIADILKDPVKFIVLQPGESFFIPLTPPVAKVDAKKFQKVIYQAHFNKLILGGGGLSLEELARFFDYRSSSKRFMMKESRWSPLSKR